LLLLELLLMLWRVPLLRVISSLILVIHILDLRYREPAVYKNKKYCHINKYNVESH
jgi:hypothetical protein